LAALGITMTGITLRAPRSEMTRRFGGVVDPTDAALKPIDLARLGRHFYGAVPLQAAK